MSETVPVIDENLIDECFPMESYRPQQREVIQGIVNAINLGYKYVIAECPTGSGKSPIAATIGALAGSGRAYYVTTTKHLQDQIEADFPDIVTVKGRNAYPCTAYDNFSVRLHTILTKEKYEAQKSEKLSCDEGYCKTNTGKGSCNLCLPSQEDKDSGRVQLPEGMEFSFCPYYEKIFSGMNAQTCSMNFNNFILHLNSGRKFAKRKILIIDEAHNTEEKLLNYLECPVSSRHIACKIPELKTAIEYVGWLQKIDALGYLKEKIAEAMESMNMKMAGMYESLFKKYINMMIEVKEDPTGWVVEYEHDKKTDVTKATLKPIFAHRAAKNFLFKFADHIVFLSATILNAQTFANNLGIQQGEYAAMRIPSQFPVENRPIVTDYAGRFTGGKAKMDGWIRDMANKVTDIARRYQDYRGIIHTHSFGIQRALMETLPPIVTNRLIQQFDYATKTEMIEAHAKRPGSIIIAPAMHEGVDLKGDLSRFQILCKVPFANFYENKQLSARMELDRGYYDFITILKIVQSVGRSVRSATDWADTFIIDESFDRVYRNNQSSFPQWFKEVVTTTVPTPRVACDGGDCNCIPLTGCQKIVQ